MLGCRTFDLKTLVKKGLLTNNVDEEDAEGWDEPHVPVHGSNKTSCHGQDDENYQEVEPKVACRILITHFVFNL